MQVCVRLRAVRRVANTIKSRSTTIFVENLATERRAPRWTDRCDPRFDPCNEVFFWAPVRVRALELQVKEEKMKMEVEEAATCTWMTEKGLRKSPI